MLITAVPTNLPQSTNTTEGTIGKQVSTPSTHFPNKEFIQNTMDCTEHNPTPNMLKDTTNALPTGPVNPTSQANNLDVSLDDSPYGNGNAQPIDVPINGETANFTANEATVDMDHDTPSTSAEKLENGEADHRAVVLANKLSTAYEEFKKSIEESPFFEGILENKEIDERTDEEAISDLQDLLDGQRTKKRSAAVEETLESLRRADMDINPSMITGVNPARSSEDESSLRNDLEFECQIIKARYDSVSYVIEKEGGNLVLRLNIIMGECAVPNLKITLPWGYPIFGKVESTLEEPASGWNPPSEAMRSSFLSSKQSSEDDHYVTSIAARWVMAAENMGKYE